MTRETLQTKIEKRAQDKANNEYEKFTDFMLGNEFCKLLKFKVGDGLIPFCGEYTKKPFFEIDIKIQEDAEDEMAEAKLHTNFDEAKKQLVELFIEKESSELLKKIDSLSDYFDTH